MWKKVAEELYRNIWDYGYIGVGILQASICINLFAWGKEKEKGDKLDGEDRVVPTWSLVRLKGLGRKVIVTEEF